MRKKIDNKMTYFIIFQLICFQAVVLNGTAVSNVIVNNGLIALWGFDGDASDFISKKQGQIHGVKAAQDRHGGSNGALLFDGSNDYISLGFNDFKFLDIQNDISLSIWIKPLRYSNVIIDNRAQVESMIVPDNGWNWQINKEGKMVFMAHNGGRDKCNTVRWAWNKDAECRVLSSQKINLNTWSHIAISKAFSVVSFYINGRFINQNLLDNRNIDYVDGDNNNRYIGRTDDDIMKGGDMEFGDQQYPHAYFDELRVYNRAISASEISQIYNYRPPSECGLAFPGTNICKSCKPGKKLENGKCIVSCRDNQWKNGEVCQDCLNVCSTCSNSTGCDTCIDDSRSGSSCSCNQGYIEFIPQQNQCQQCNVKCKQCQNNIDNCTECVSDTRTGSDCHCKEGYYENGNEQDCLQCEYPCLFCQSKSLCISCSSLENRENTTTCQCQQEYYDNGAICEKCNERCLVCENNPDNCTQCKNNENRQENPNPTCLCKIGYFENQNSICEKCSHRCDTCQENQNNCEQCSNSLRNIDNECKCQEGYYEIEGQSDCFQCEYPCQNCLSQNKCLSCQNPSNRDEQCRCLNGFFENSEQICEKCEYPCQLCIDQNQCLSCKFPDNRNPDNSQCQCNQGYYDDPLKGCSQCENGSILLDNKCQKCDDRCKLCENEIDSCTECYSDTRFGDKCECKTGYIESGQQECQKIQCKSNLCLSCDQSQNCFQLNKEVIGYIENGLPYQCLPYCNSCISQKDCISTDPIKYEEYQKNQENGNKGTGKEKENVQKKEEEIMSFSDMVWLVLLVLLILLLIIMGMYLKMRKQNQVLDITLQQIKSVKDNSNIHDQSSNSHNLSFQQSMLNQSQQQILSQLYSTQQLNQSCQEIQENISQQTHFKQDSVTRSQENQKEGWSQILESKQSNEQNDSKQIDLPTPLSEISEEQVIGSCTSSESSRQRQQDSDCLQKQISKKELLTPEESETKTESQQNLKEIQTNENVNENNEIINIEDKVEVGQRNDNNVCVAVDELNTQKIELNIHEIKQNEKEEEIELDENQKKLNLDEYKNKMKFQEDKFKQQSQILYEPGQLQNKQQQQKEMFAIEIEPNYQKILEQYQEEEEQQQNIEQVQNGSDNNNNEVQYDNDDEISHIQKQEQEDESNWDDFQQDSLIQQQQFEKEEQEDGNLNLIQLEESCQGVKEINLMEIQWDKIQEIMVQYGLSQDDIISRLRNQDLPMQIIKIILDIGIDKKIESSELQSFVENI